MMIDANTAIGRLPLQKQQIEVQINTVPGPVRRVWHRAQVIRVIQGAEVIRPTPACAPVPARFGLAVDSNGETLFVEVRP